MQLYVKGPIESRWLLRCIQTQNRKNGKSLTHVAYHIKEHVATYKCFWRVDLWQELPQARTSQMFWEILSVYPMFVMLANIYECPSHIINHVHPPLSWNPNLACPQARWARECGTCATPGPVLRDDAYVAARSAVTVVRFFSFERGAQCFPFAQGQQSLYLVLTPWHTFAAHAALSGGRDSLSSHTWPNS